MMSSKNKRVFICDFSNLTSQIIFDARWASINVHLRRPIGCNKSSYAPSWRFYLHCRMEENGSPGSICIVCYQVLRHPSEHGISWIGKKLLAKSRITKLNELTESEITELTSSTVDETALAILKRQGCQGIRIVSVQSKFIFHIYVLSILTELTDKTLQTGSKGLSNCQISPKYLELLPNVGMCFSSHSVEQCIKPRATTVV